MRKAKIYIPSKTAMQSGNRKAKKWLLEFKSSDNSINQLMGWESSKDTMSQVRLDFSTKEHAISYAKKNNIDYYIEEPQKRKFNKSDKKLSIASLISEKNKLKNLVIFSDFKDEIKKTKEMNKIINKFEIKNSLLILDKLSKDKIYKSVRNIPTVKVTDVNHFSAFDVVKFKKIVFTESSVKELEKRYA